MSAGPETVVERQRIDTEDGNLARWADEAWCALIDANDERSPTIMVRGDTLVRMTERGQLEEFLRPSLRDDLSRIVDFGQQQQSGWKSRPPPVEVVDALLYRDSSSYGGAPRVERVVDVPVVAADGSFLVEPGYDPRTRVFYRPSEDVKAATVPDVDVVYDIDEALDLLIGKGGLLGDFVFDSDASRANALGLLLLPFVRDLIDGPTPLHLIDASQPGCGKSWLAEVALLPGCGVVPREPEARDDEEWRKRLTANMLGGVRAMVFDNLRRVLDSGALAAAITTGEWSDRLLGQNKRVTIPVRHAWVATGNNVQLTDEQARRVCPIFLDPGDDDPPEEWEHSRFSHPDLLLWARRNRAELVTAALTLVRNWVDGQPVLVDGHRLEREPLRSVPTSRPPRSFGQWHEVIGGILAAAGVNGFMTNDAKLQSRANAERRDVEDFLAAWHARMREPVEIGTVVDKCLSPGGVNRPLHDSLPTSLIGQSADALRLRPKLGAWLRDHKDRWWSDYQLVRHEGRPVRWSVRKRAVDR